MFVKRLVIGFATLVTSLAVMPGAAQAGPNDNNGATVSGVRGVDANGPGCATGNFCIYTKSDGNGIEFSLFHCREYSLNGWNGIGSFTNNNTGGARAQLLDRNHRVLRTSTPFEFDDSVDFRPVWYIKAC